MATYREPRHTSLGGSFQPGADYDIAGAWHFDQLPTTGSGRIPVTFQDTLTVASFGAIGDGVADDTAAIQRALDAATGGQRLWMGRGQYLISAPLVPRSFVRWEGIKGEETGGGIIGGSTLKWSGTGTGPMVWLHGTYGCNLDGINLDGSNTTGLTGFRIDSTNTPPSQRNTIRNFTAAHFGRFNTDVAGTAVHLGDSLTDGAQTQYQSDGILLENFLITDAHTGVYFNSQNIQYTAVRSFAITAFRYGLHVHRNGFANVATGAGGLVGGTNGAFFLLDGICGVLHVVSVQCEQTYPGGIAGTGQWLRISSAAATELTPILFEGCIWNLPSDVQNNHRILSLGNHYTAALVLSGSDSVVYSLGDLFTNPDARTPFPSIQADGVATRVVGIDSMGEWHLPGLISRADNAAALAAGLTVGQVYHTNGTLKVVT